MNDIELHMLRSEVARLAARVERLEAVNAKALADLAAKQEAEAARAAAKESK